MLEYIDIPNSTIYASTSMNHHHITSKVLQHTNKQPKSTSFTEVAKSTSFVDSIQQPKKPAPNYDQTNPKATQIRTRIADMQASCSAFEEPFFDFPAEKI